MNRPDADDGLGCLLVLFLFVAASFALALCESSFFPSPSGFAP